MGSRLKNRSTSPLSLKNRCIRGSLPASGPKPSCYPHAAHPDRLLTPSVKAALRPCRTRRSSHNQAVPFTPSIRFCKRRHYGPTVGTNNSCTRF
jgi:hypothetical protein